MSPPSSVQLTNAMYFPSGDQTGECSPSSAIVRRFGVPGCPPAGGCKSMIHRRSSAEKTSRFPFGEGRAPRICRTVSVESFTGYSKRTKSPIIWSTSAVNGIGVC
jgi:hypothetical protein